MKTRSSSVCIPVALSALLIACGGDDDDDGGGGADADGADPPGDAGLGGDAGADEDSGVACGRELLAGPDLGAPDHMIADETHLYLAAYTKDEHRVWRIDRESGEAELLAALPEIYRSDSLALDGDFVYFSGSPLTEPTPQPPAIGLFRVSRSGGGEPERISTDNAESLAFDATHVYWLTHDTFQHFVIKRRAKSGGEEELLVEADTTTNLGPRMTVLGEHVYWDVGVELRRAPTAGGPSEVFGNLDPEGPPGTCEFCLDQMLAADGQLYWLKVTSDGTHFYRTRSDVFELEPLVADAMATAVSGHPFFLFDGHLYWATQGPGIRRAPASGGDAIGVKERNAPAFVPTSDGLYTVNWLDVVRLMPLEGCPE